MSREIVQFKRRGKFGDWWSECPDWRLTGNSRCGYRPGGRHMEYREVEVEISEPPLALWFWSKPKKTTRLVWLDERRVRVMRVCE